jgi:hypothetical protein
MSTVELVEDAEVSPNVVEGVEMSSDVRFSLLILSKLLKSAQILLRS